MTDALLLKTFAPLLEYAGMRLVDGVVDRVFGGGAVGGAGGSGENFSGGAANSNLAQLAAQNAQFIADAKRRLAAQKREFAAQKREFAAQQRQNARSQHQLQAHSEELSRSFDEQLSQALAEQLAQANAQISQLQDEFAAQLQGLARVRLAAGSSREDFAAARAEFAKCERELLAWADWVAQAAGTAISARLVRLVESAAAAGTSPRGAGLAGGANFTNDASGATFTSGAGLAGGENFTNGANGVVDVNGANGRANSNLASLDGAIVQTAGANGTTPVISASAGKNYGVTFATLTTTATGAFFATPATLAPAQLAEMFDEIFSGVARRLQWAHSAFRQGITAQLGVGGGELFGILQRENGAEKERALAGFLARVRQRGLDGFVAAAQDALGEVFSAVRVRLGERLQTAQDNAAQSEEFLRRLRSAGDAAGRERVVVEVGAKLARYESTLLKL